MSDEYFTPQHVAGTRAGAEGYQAMTPKTQRLDELFRLLDGTESPDDCYAILEMAWREGHAAADAALDEVRAEVSRLEAIKTPDASFTYCAYCGEKSPVDEHNEDLSAHIKTCLKHPMRDLEHQLALKARRLAVVEEALKRIADTADGYEGSVYHLLHTIAKAALAGADEGEAQATKETTP